MSREIFEVTKDRFHLQNPCCYILQGTWPKEAKMRAMLDGSEIKSEIQRLEVVSALERFKDPDLMRGERITAAVQLPESLEGYQKLSVYADMPDKTFCWFSVAVKNLEKRRGKPQFFIEEEKIQQGFLRIRGWAVADQQVRIQIFNENKEKIQAEIRFVMRMEISLRVKRHLIFICVKHIRIPMVLKKTYDLKQGMFFQKIIMIQKCHIIT